jgi:hypothetical protein
MQHQPRRAAGTGLQAMIVAEPSKARGSELPK